MSQKKLNWDFIKRCLAFRKEEKKLKKLGYKIHETDWEIHRGPHIGKVIVDVKISIDGKYVYTLIGDKS